MHVITHVNGHWSKLDFTFFFEKLRFCIIYELNVLSSIFISSIITNLIIAMITVIILIIMMLMGMLMSRQSITMLGRKQSLVGEHNLVTADYLEEVNVNDGDIGGDDHDGDNDLDGDVEDDSGHQMTVLQL